MTKTVLTLGTFDLFHRGHVELLRKCGAIGDRVIVGLNTDAFIERYKGRPPVIAYEDRRAVLEACRFVSAVVPNAQADGSIRDVLGEVRPHVIAVGTDWQAHDYMAQLGITMADLDLYGTVIQYLPYTSGISSTAIRKRLAA